MAIEVDYEKLQHESEDLRMAYAQAGLLGLKEAIDIKYMPPFRVRFHRNCRKRNSTLK